MPKNSENIFSVIDLGTNTCLLLIATLEKNKLTKIFEAQKTPRIGKDLYKTGNISAEKFPEAAKIFKYYISLSEKYNSSAIIAAGTSALRDAENRNEFINFIKAETGISISVISGKEEAYYGYVGAVFDLDNSIEYAVLDIGGGSTEISMFEKGKFKSESIDIGSVRIYENFLKDGITDEKIIAAKNFIKSSIADFISENIRFKSLAGIAGTMTTLSAIKNKLKKFDEEVIHKDCISAGETEMILRNLLNMTENERLNLGEYMKGRSDIIVSGVMILTEVLNHFNFKEIIVSTKGLRYGLLLNIDDFY